MARRASLRTRVRGQTLVEFALVAPVLFVLLGAIVQVGLVFWAQNTLTQVVQDTARWAATQQGRPCDAGGPALVAQADQVARRSSLLGYTAGQWTAPGAYSYGVSPAPREGIEVSWPISTDRPGLVNTDCPPDTNETAWFVNIRGHHVVPVFFPGIAAVFPNCDNTGCSLSAQVQFRMEPAP